MYWALWPLIATAIACAGTTAKSEPIAPAPVRKAEAPAPVESESAPTDHTAMDAAMADLRTIANEMCTCPDTVCLDAATAKLELLSKKYSNVSFEDVPKEALDEVQAIAKRMADCAARITTGRSPRPKLPGQM